MAINRISSPTVPNPIEGDWALIMELLTTLFKTTVNKAQVSGSNITDGSVFHIGGVIYYTNGETAITGTASNYVKLTVAVGGATASPSFVSNLSGVTWNDIHNGYYDISGNLYLFNEAIAKADGQIATLKRPDVQVASDSVIAGNFTFLDVNTFSSIPIFPESTVTQNNLVSTERMTTANVLAQTASAAVGAVGTYAFLLNTSTTARTPGQTLAGSSLRYVGAARHPTTMDFAHVRDAVRPSGTWRLMGDSYQASNWRSASVWLRIS